MLTDMDKNDLIASFGLAKLKFTCPYKPSNMVEEKIEVLQDKLR